MKLCFRDWLRKCSTNMDLARWHVSLNTILPSLYWVGRKLHPKKYENVQDLRHVGDKLPVHTVTTDIEPHTPTSLTFSQSRPCKDHECDTNASLSETSQTCRWGRYWRAAKMKLKGAGCWGPLPTVGAWWAVVLIHQDHLHAIGSAL